MSTRPLKERLLAHGRKPHDYPTDTEPLMQEAVTELDHLARELKKTRERLSHVIVDRARFQTELARARELLADLLSLTAVELANVEAFLAKEKK